MRLLFDQNISFRITKKINHIFPDCKHVSDCGLIDCEDNDIWVYAKENNYAIVTFDSDFYDISVIDGPPPKIIWIRTGNLTTKGIVRLLIDKKDSIEEFINSGDQDISCLEVD